MDKDGKGTVSYASEKLGKQLIFQVIEESYDKLYYFNKRITLNIVD